MQNETEWTPDDGLVESAPVGLRQSDSTDDDGDGVYHFVIPFNGHRYFAREMNQEVLDEYYARQDDLQARNDAARNDGQAVLIGGKPDLKKRKEASLLAPQLLVEQQKIITWVLEQSLVGWTRPQPFSFVAVRALTVTARTAIAKEVIKGSVMGGDAAPLADSF